MAPYMSGEFLISPVLSHCSKNLKRRTDWYYSSVLFGKQRKIHPQGMRAGWPQSEEKRSPQFSFGSTFYMFFPLPLSLSYVKWASQESCLFHLRFSLVSLDLPLFYFQGFSLLCLLPYHSGLLFPILPNRSIQKIPFVITFNIPNINILSKD